MAGIFGSIGGWSMGFDHTTARLDCLTGYDGSSGLMNIQTQWARYAAPTGATSMGLQAAPSGTNDYGHLTLGTQLINCISGIAVNFSAFPASGNAFFYQYYDSVGAAGQVTFCVNSNGKLVMTRGATNGTVLATGTTTLLTNTWYYVEPKCKIDPTTGIAEIRLNGSVEATFSGNTRNTANTWTDLIYIGSTTSNVSILFDDWYILDTTAASPNNTYLGDKREVYFPANADSATAGLNQWSTSPNQSAGSHYLNVNSVPGTGANYNFDANPGDRESYRHASLPGLTAGISWTTVRNKFEKDDAGSRSCALTMRSGTTDSVGPTISSPSSYSFANKIDLVDPSTGAAWTPGGVNNNEPGHQVIS